MPAARARFSHKPHGLLHSSCWPSTRGSSLCTLVTLVYFFFGFDIENHACQKLPQPGLCWHALSKTISASNKNVADDYCRVAIKFIAKTCNQNELTTWRLALVCLTSVPCLMLAISDHLRATRAACQIPNLNEAIVPRGCKPWRVKAVRLRGFENLWNRLTFLGANLREISKRNLSQAPFICRIHCNCTYPAFVSRPSVLICCVKLRWGNETKTRHR